MICASDNGTTVTVRFPLRERTDALDRRQKGSIGLYVRGMSDAWPQEHVMEDMKARL
jgi:hypothetical protein